MSNTVLLSVRPEYADKIFSGTKTVELRRIFPKATIDTVLMYVTSPVKALVGITTVEKVIVQHPFALWKRVRNEAGITYEEFETYYEGASLGYAIFLDEVKRFSQPISLNELREQWAGFQPPQSYFYLHVDQIKWIYQSAHVPLNLQPRSLAVIQQLLF